MFLNPAVDPIRFSTSWLVKANTLFLLRAIISLYIFASIIAKLSYYGANEPTKTGPDFSYFTSITFWGLAFYFAFAALHSATYWRTGSPALARWQVVLRALHSIFYSTITVYPILVTIVYWSLLYSGFNSKFNVWSNVTQHALNSVFCLFEIFIPRTDPLPWIHILWLVIMLALYLGVAFITLATEHFYVYSFLDYHSKGGRGRVAGYILGILVAAIVIFIIVHFIMLLRKWITETKLKKTGRLEHRGPKDYVDEAELGNILHAKETASGST